MRKAETKAIVAMVIFGSIGLFVRWIPLSSSEIAFYRAVLGSLFLLITGLLQQMTVSASDLKRNFRPLLFTGVALGLNWVFLFEAYKHTTMANVTISYYMAPVLVMFVAPIILQEKRTVRKTVCAGVVLLGLMIMMQSAAQPSVGTGTLTGLLSCRVTKLVRMYSNQ